MTREDVMARIEAELGDRIIELNVRSSRRAFVHVGPRDVLDIARLMFETLGARLLTATGVDTPTAMELLYHWALDGLGFVITVRIHLHREHPEIDSIAAICPAAEWIEREIWELLGVQFRNHPDPRHLLLGDDWPEGKYPLRRDYER